MINGGDTLADLQCKFIIDYMTGIHRCTQCKFIIDKMIARDTQIYPMRIYNRVNDRQDTQICTVQIYNKLDDK